MVSPLQKNKIIIDILILICDDIYMNKPIDNVIALYKKEFTRTTGKTTNITQKGSWLTFSYSGTKIRTSKLPGFIATLSSRTTHPSQFPDLQK